MTTFIADFINRLFLKYLISFIIIISLLMPTAGAQAFLMDYTRKTGYNSPRGPSAGWWVLTTANTAGTNGLT
jgi:hypothetical protein